MQAVQTANPTSVQSAQTRPKALHIGLWVVQGLLAAAFVMAGAMKLGSSQADIIAMGDHMAWAGRVPAGLIKLIGAAELLGGLGLVLPAATRVAPKLTPIAALGLVTVMVLAASHHLMNGEAASIGSNVVLALLAGFVAWGRLLAAPIAARGEH